MMKSYFGSAVLVAGAVAGYVTALQALGHAGTSQAVENNKWMTSRVDEKDSHAIYALGHFRNEGFLPPPRTTLYFTRLQDDEGSSLRGDCAYEISGPALQARWWSVIAAPASSPAMAKAFTAGNAVLPADDSLRITLSRKAYPGNWLQPPAGNTLRVSLVLNEPYVAAKSFKLVLPQLKRLACE
jgi:hypothetical protein